MNYQELEADYVERNKALVALWDSIETTRCREQCALIEKSFPELAAWFRQAATFKDRLRNGDFSRSQASTHALNDFMNHLGYAESYILQARTDLYDHLTQQARKAPDGEAQ